MLSTKVTDVSVCTNMYGTSTGDSNRNVVWFLPCGLSVPVVFWYTMYLYCVLAVPYLYIIL